jgi:hypothetical protein
MRRRSAHGGSRGSALVTVILVILILTVVGLGVAYFAQMEEGLSGNARMMRSAFYVSEVGLRKGESVIQFWVNANNGLSSLLACGSCSTLNVPGGGWPGILLQATDPEDGNLKPFENVPVPVPAGVFDRGTFSLYVRNNVEDPAGQNSDGDSVIVLISVGRVPGVGGRVFTKMVEEELVTGTFGGPAFAQYLSNAGGTSSGVSGQ